MIWFGLIVACVILILWYMNKQNKPIVLRKGKAKKEESVTEQEAIASPVISRDYYNSLIEAIKPIVKLYNCFIEDEVISGNIDSSLPQSFGDTSAKLSFLFHADVRKLYAIMGHDLVDMNTKEGIALLLLSYATQDSKRLFATPYEDLGSIIDDIQSCKENYDRTENAFANYPDDDFYFQGVILERSNRKDIQIEYCAYYWYDFFKLIADIDNNLSWNEIDWLDNLKERAGKHIECNDLVFKINV